MISEESLDKQRQSLLELALSGRYSNHCLCLYTQSYLARPKNLKRHVKPIIVCYSKECADLKMIHDKNNVLTYDALVIVRDFKIVNTCMLLHKK